jgi:hypothetical protein
LAASAGWRRDDGTHVDENLSRAQSRQHPVGPSVIAANAAALVTMAKVIGSGGYGARRVRPLHSFLNQPLRFGARAVVTGYGMAFIEQPVHHLAAHHSQIR